MPDWMDEELNERRRQGLYRARRRLQSGQGATVRLNGRTYRNFSSNNYLNLANDPRLARAAARAALRYGTGAGASPLVSGYLPPLRTLERALADWEGTEAALVCASGYAANLAVLTALAGPSDAIFSDASNHASLIDGCRLTRAHTHVYRHNDPSHLEHLLRFEAGPARRKLIVSDSVFSMDGDLAPLAELLTLAERYDCLLVLDEAHGTGVLGERGRGLTDLLPSATRGLDRLIKVGTLSKALGGQGGFVCGSGQLIDFLINHARPYIFSTALSPPLAAAARRAIAIVEQEPQRRHHLRALAQKLRGGLVGLDKSSGVPIVPVIVGEARVAVALSERLQEQGLLVPAIRPPSVPEGTARLRISLTAGHTSEDIEILVGALGEVTGMKAVLCERWGDPEEVLQVRDIPMPPEPKRGEVRVRMLLSPINPSDLLMIQGRYGRQPTLPATPGFEGVGIVEAGRGLLARRVLGRRVAVLNSVTGNWQEYVVIPARQAIPVSRALTDEQAATFFVNPASALVMTRHVLRVPRGAWLLQTAAGSALGRMVIRLGKIHGFRTLNAVRRREQGEELLRLGDSLGLRSDRQADPRFAVICTSDENLHRRVLEITKGEGVHYAIDAVAGSTGSEAVGTLARGGRLLIYGALSGQPLTLDPRTLLIGQKKVEGFWLSEWVRDAGILRMLLLLRQVDRLIRLGVLATEVGTTFALDDVRTACRVAAEPGRQGKVLLRIAEKTQ